MFGVYDAILSLICCSFFQVNTQVWAEGREILLKSMFSVEIH